MALLISSFGIIWAQYSADPFSKIYTDIDQWEGRGYISHLPSFRPLPEVVLAAAMREVINKGDKSAIKKAQSYLTEINNFGITTNISLFGRINSVGGNIQAVNRSYGNGSIEVSGSSRISEIISLSTKIGGHLIFDKDAEKHVEMNKTYYLQKSQNKLEELENIKVTTIDPVDINMTFTNRTSFTIGTENLFLHAGFMRRSIGPFHEDGIIISPLAPQSSNIFVYWEGGEKIAVTWGIFALSSSQEYLKFDYDETTGDITSESSTRNKTNKFFYYNSLSWFIQDKLEISIFESVMFGNFNLGYLLPLKMIYAVDSQSDFSAGNLMAGFNIKYKPIKTITLPFSLLVDDISISEYITLNFYSKLKVASEIGIQWNPLSKYFKELKLGYQIVTPYTYTHVPISSNELYSTAYNTENHTHQGHHFASTLEPNSHRIYISTIISPIHYLTLEGFVRLEQHSNASAGILKGILNDGSILDDGYRSVYDPQNTGADNATFQHRLDFLTGTLETKVETGVNLEFIFPIARKINIYSDINYSFRYTNNYLLSSDVKLEGIFQMELGLQINNKIVK